MAAHRRRARPGHGILARPAAEVYLALTSVDRPSGELNHQNYAGNTRCA